MAKTINTILHRLASTSLPHELAEKDVLDVGGGRGILSFYAAAKGAKKVVCLEPEFARSASGIMKRFYNLQKDFPASLPVELSTHTPFRSRLPANISVMVH